MKSRIHLIVFYFHKKNLIYENNTFIDQEKKYVKGDRIKYISSKFFFTQYILKE